MEVIKSSENNTETSFEEMSRIIKEQKEKGFKCAAVSLEYTSKGKSYVIGLFEKRGDGC